MQKNWKYILVLTLTLALVVTVELLSPQPVNWNPSLVKKDKIPFGTHILYNLISDIFPNQAIRTATNTIYEELELPDSSQALANYLFIDNTFQPGEEDVHSLLEWVSEGNNVFIAAEQFGGKIADTLKLKTEFDFQTFTDSFPVNFVNPTLQLAKGYTFSRVNTPMYFARLDTLRSLVLGVDSLNRPNFIQTNWGKGHFFLHSLPLAFTNYHLLFNNNAEYISKSLSYLPVRPLIWDEYYKPGRQEDSQSPLRFFVQNEALRWALYLSLLALVLFILFEAKRRQRIIPIIQPLTNTTLEFTETVGRLYFQHQDHKNIGEKKITYLLDFIRSRYFLPTTQRNSAFYENLHRKTGIEKGEIIHLFDVIENVQRQTMIAEVELLDLNRAIEQFYEKAG
ncbi:MAG: DUF4350 domain-containing protein [Bacteroidota bacterium]